MKAPGLVAGDHHVEENKSGVAGPGGEAIGITGSAARVTIPGTPRSSPCSSLPPTSGAPHARLPRARVVDSFAALVATPLGPDVNALGWRRVLAGDFAEVARALAPADGLVQVDVDTLRGLRLAPAGRVAAEVIVDDIVRLEALGLDPVVNCIARYPRDERGLPIATDVLSFHVDRAPVAVDTWLCTYHGAPSELLDNDAARRRIDLPDVRAALRTAWPTHAAVDDDDNDDNDDNDEDDDDRFDRFVVDGSFDLHYVPQPGGAAVAVGVGELWRLAVLWPGSRALPCIHRAPTHAPDEPRLLLLC
jgi:hypothetical protein